MLDGERRTMPAVAPRLLQALYVHLPDIANRIVVKQRLGSPVIVQQGSMSWLLLKEGCRLGLALQ